MPQMPAQQARAVSAHGRLRLVVFVLAAITAACARPAPDDHRLHVVATISPITDLVQAVAGNRASVEGLIPEGVDSHTFQPSPGDARRLAEADLVFLNGLHLEEPTRRLGEANRKDGARIVELAARAIRRSEWIFDFSFPRSGGDPNPHLWTNPPYAKRYTEVIRAELSRADPQGSRDYADNQAVLAGKIDRLGEAFRRAAETIPQERRKLLTYHDSFPYLARDFGWTVVGAIQPADFAEPSPREVAGLIRQIRAEQVPAIFGSEVFPSPVLEAIARESGARYVADLRDDDLPGEPGEPDHSYLGLMRFDLLTIVEALGGDASALLALDVRSAPPVSGGS